MSLPDEQGPQRRRANRQHTDEQGPQSLLVSNYDKQAPKLPSHNLPNDDTLIDDPPLPRQNSSVVRLAAPNTTTQRPTGNVPARPIPPRRQTQDVPLRATRAGLQPPPREQREASQLSPFKRFHWLLYVGVGMLAMLVIFVLGSWVVGWGSQRLDDMRYGNPRTYQIDKFVGDGDSAQHPSHFIAMNLNRQAIVVQFVGGDPTKSFVYVAPVLIGGEGGNLAPVTVDFSNITGHTDGKLDMIITIHLAQNQQFFFVNDGNGFRPSNANDKIHT